MANYKALKGNIQLTLDNESQAKAYQGDGYDIYEDGELILHGKGKTVSYDKYDEALARIEELEGELADAGNADEKALKAELKAAKDALAAANKEIADKDKQIIDLTKKLEEKDEDEEEFK